MVLFSADFPEHLKDDSRVNNGFKAGKPLPYQLQLMMDVRLPNGTKVSFHFCGATLISKQYAISALHCFQDNMDYNMVVLSVEFSAFIFAYKKYR